MAAVYGSGLGMRHLYQVAKPSAPLTASYPAAPGRGLPRSVALLHIMFYIVQFTTEYAM